LKENNAARHPVLGAPAISQSSFEGPLNQIEAEFCNAKKDDHVESTMTPFRDTDL
jgi:hypothetical protein